MLTGFLITGVISGWIWTYKCTGAPTVTLTADSSPYFDIGGSIALTCSISEDVNSDSAYLRKDGKTYVWIQIHNSSSCGWTRLTSNDPHDYSVTCKQRMTIRIVINRAVAADHNAEWSCEMQCSSCDCPDGSCISTSSVRTALRVLVSSVQLKDGTGQLLVTPVSVLEGTNKDFQCDTSPNGSRPRALFNWYKKSENQSPILIQDQSISTPGPRPEFDLSISISNSTLTLMGSRSCQNMYIYCEAQDDTMRGHFSRTREVQLNILYPPVVQLFPKTSSFNVTEGSTKFEFRCNVTDANPMPRLDGYSWLLGGQIIQGQTRSSLELLNVQKYLDGVYQCMARNEYGIGNSNNMYLNVQYGPTISLIDYTAVEEGDNVSIACNVTGNPQPDIVWTRYGTVLLPSSDTLRIPNISRLHEGNYTCTASNVLYPTGQAPVSKKASHTLRISVLYHPQTDFRSPPVTTVYSWPHGKASLTYTVISLPEPTFNWTFIGNGNDSRRLPDSATQHDSGLQSILIFTNLSINDFGFYRVTAKNTFPTSATELFQLIPADVPDIPSNVKVTDIRQTSLTVQWIAGFNGGLEQTFHITITASDITRSVYAPDPGYGKSGTQTIDNLIDNTEYGILMSANNSLGSSSVTNVIKISTLKEIKDCACPVGVVAGSILGSFVAGACVGVVIICLWQRWQKSKRKGDTYESVDIVGRNPNKENVYDSLKHGETESSGDNTYDNTGAAASHGSIKSRTNQKDQNMEMMGRNS